MKYTFWNLRTAWYVLACVLLVMLTGCYPKYDWRQITLGNGHVRAMLPGKPHTSERELEFEGHPVIFMLTSASVDGILFTIGYAALPPALQEDEAARMRLLQSTQVSLYRNLDVEPPERLPAAGERFSVSGHGHGQPLRIEALAWTTREALIEGLVVGPADALPQDEITEFLRELAPDLQLRKP